MTAISDFRASVLRSIPGLFLVLLFVSYGECKDSQTGDDSSFERVITLPTDSPFPESSFLTTEKKRGQFALVENGVPGDILISNSDHPGVLKIAGLFQKDLSYVSGQEATLTIGDIKESKNLIIAGTVGKSKL